MDEPHAPVAPWGEMHDVHAPPAPQDVVELLAARGYRVACALGADGSRWVATAVHDPAQPDVEVQLLAAPLDDALAARAAVALGVEHPHVAATWDAVALGEGRTALLVEHVEGTTLADVRAARAPLTDAEAATVAIPLAQALDVLHAAGAVHGAVGADRVVLRADGFPVLVDGRAGLVGQGSPAGDLRRLVVAVLAVMAPAEAYLAAALDDGPSLRDDLEALLRAEDLTGARVVDTCFAAVTPDGVQMPDAGALAGASVLRAEVSARTTGVRGPGAPLPRRTDGREPRPGAGRVRRPRRPVVVVAAAVAGVLVLGAGAWGVLQRTAAASAGDHVASAGDTPAAGAAAQAPAAGGTAAVAADVDAVHDREDPASAAAALTRLRAAALAEPSAAAVAGVHVAGSPALAADVALLEALDGASSEGLAVEVADAAVVPTGSGSGTGTDGSDDVLVAVTSTTGAHTRVARDGTRTAVPATRPTTVDLLLRWTADGWRVQDVRTPAGTAP
ncbi:hypothetical protein [Cellulomonas sp. SLBN-39]|uniref:hypothetical protein n=1 Tax=Cellulomonas sp. SLBN-39 TaxID=2768446 RepID=UPI00114ED94D|nr:hypothetical protein [Cellulomonas sp. SLBN-39]TQL03895.1 hypothetical protein FBY24_3005 [Cellulomonas sp. SLBN-39]